MDKEIITTVIESKKENIEKIIKSLLRRVKKYDATLKIYMVGGYRYVMAGYQCYISNDCFYTTKSMTNTLMYLAEDIKEIKEINHNTFEDKIYIYEFK